MCEYHNNYIAYFGSAFWTTYIILLQLCINSIHVVCVFEKLCHTCFLMILEYLKSNSVCYGSKCFFIDEVWTCVCVCMCACVCVCACVWYEMNALTIFKTTKVIVCVVVYEFIKPIYIAWLDCTWSIIICSKNSFLLWRSAEVNIEVVLIVQYLEKAKLNCTLGIVQLSSLSFIARIKIKVDFHLE